MNACSNIKREIIMTIEIFESKNPLNLKHYFLKPYDVIDSIISNCVAENIFNLRVLLLNNPEAYTDLGIAISIADNIPINMAPALYELRMTYDENRPNTAETMHDFMYDISACVANNVTILGNAQKRLDQKWKDAGPMPSGYIELPPRNCTIYKFSKTKGS